MKLELYPDDFIISRIKAEHVRLEREGRAVKHVDLTAAEYAQLRLEMDLKELQIPQNVCGVPLLVDGKDVYLEALKQMAEESGLAMPSLGPDVSKTEIN